MGVYLPNMEMPKNCYKCNLRRRDGMDIVCPVAHERFSVADVNILEYRLENCPLVPVPPHGRLIDADALANKHRTMAYEDGGRKYSFHASAKSWVEEAPTVIEAEEGET